MEKAAHDSVARVAVVGAGLSGLIAARALKAAGLPAIVLDKGRGVGGRLATRRIAEASFDHGAQYFTARSEAFRELTREWLEARVVKPWADGFALPDGNVKTDGETRFRGVSGMTAIAKHLARGLDVRLSTKVTAIRAVDGRWELQIENAAALPASALVLTAPVPQSLALLGAGGTMLPSATHAALSRIRYNPCLALMVLASGPDRIPAPGGLWLEGEPLSWIASNSQKGIATATNGAVAFTLHAGPDFSRTQWDADSTETSAKLIAAAERWIGGKVLESQLHRWRYSRPTVTHPEPVLVADTTPPLLFAGDAFGGPRIEGAALSGLAAAKALCRSLAH